MGSMGAKNWRKRLGSGRKCLSFCIKCSITVHRAQICSQKSVAEVKTYATIFAKYGYNLLNHILLRLKPVFCSVTPIDPFISGHISHINSCPCFHPVRQMLIPIGEPRRHYSGHSQNQRPHRTCGHTHLLRGLVLV